MYATLLMVLLLPVGLQEADPEGDYRQEYAHYDDLTKIADPAERAEAFLDFVDQGFDDRLIGGVQAGIQMGIEELAGAGRLDEMYPLAERWDSQTGDLTGTAMSLQSAAAAGDSENIVKYGEIIYEVNPIVDIAEILAQSYSALGNEDRYLEYAGIVVEEKGIAGAFDHAYNLFLAESDDLDAAADWARKLKALPSAPSGVSAAEWRNLGIEFQRTIARAEFEGGRYQNAIREYQALAGMDRSQRAISNFYLGRSYFELGGPSNVNLALSRFADAAVLNDPTYSDPAMTMVYDIYETNTGGTREGINENVMNAARARMR